MKYPSITLIPLALMSGFLLVIGVKGILDKKPFLLPAYAFNWIMAVYLLLNYIIPGIKLISDTPGEPLYIFLGFLAPILMVAALAFAVWQNMIGYSAYGVTRESFKAALHSALEKLNLPYTDLVSRIELPSIGADLQVSVQTWWGIGELKVKPGKHRQMLRTIVKDMNEYFRTAPGSRTLKPSIFNIVIGIIGIIFTVYLVMKK